MAKCRESGLCKSAAIAGRPNGSRERRPPISECRVDGGTEEIEVDTDLTRHDQEAEGANVPADRRGADLEGDRSCHLQGGGRPRAAGSRTRTPTSATSTRSRGAGTSPRGRSPSSSSPSFGLRSAHCANGSANGVAADGARGFASRPPTPPPPPPPPRRATRLRPLGAQTEMLLMTKILLISGTAGDGDFEARKEV
jgi:hypothetical protein